MFWEGCYSQSPRAPPPTACIQLTQMVFENMRLHCWCFRMERFYIQTINQGSSHCGIAEMNSARIHEVAGSIPGFAQWVKNRALP